MNEVIQRNDKNNGNKIKIVIIVLLVIIVLGLLAYIIFGKNINKESENNTANTGNNTSDVVTLDINSDLVKNLKIPYAVEESSYFSRDLRDFKVSKGMMKYIRDLVFHYLYIDPSDSSHWESGDSFVELDLPYISDCGAYFYVSADEMKNKFKEFFGPDVKYVDGQGELTYSRGKVDKFYYSEKDSRYYYEACAFGGGEGFYGSKVYKAQQKGDEIYVYIIAYTGNYIENEIYDISTDNYLGIYKDIDKELDNATIEKLINENKLNTYKFTFKKQSDGKYYVYSGEWM
ncbi:MAG: hypothetical protein NC096_05630 [Candidatus Amulumruptor caecigallinarius]|nr:hypothetical protein [Candidatus Amulumruptor caecigallinarius]